MKIVIAPDSFKGAMRSDVVAETIAEAWHEVYPDDELFLLMGSDMLMCFEQWNSFEEILEEVTLAVVSRTDGDFHMLEEKAEELLPMVVYGLLPLDRLKKKSVGEASISSPELLIELDDLWPLDGSFLPCAAHYLASYMIGADDPDLANLLYVRAEAMKRIISDGIPYVIEKF